MKSYLTVNDGQSTVVISRSRFITYVMGIACEADAAAALNRLRKTHYDATHVCYAYRLYDGELSRYSDDGEPQGTAGPPIMEALKKAQAADALVAVVRYFGGIKLGTGGLTRAYFNCAYDAVTQAGLKQVLDCAAYRITAEHKLLGTLRHIVQKRGGFITEQEFTERVAFTLLSADDEQTVEALTSAAMGQIESQFLGRRKIDKPPCTGVK